MVHAVLVYQKSWMTTCDENPCLNAFSIAEVILSVEFWLTKKSFIYRHLVVRLTKCMSGTPFFWIKVS